MQIEKIIVIMGPPGSGKGTQSKLLGEKLGYVYFSTGALLRDIAKEGTSLGKEISNYIDQGIIIPDEMMVEIFRKKIASLGNVSGIILDGYPRTPGQAKILEDLLPELGNPKLTALFLEVDKQKLLGRIQKRKTCSKCQAIYLETNPEYQSVICSKCGGQLVVRADDDLAVIEKRFEEYQTKTAPVKQHYEKLGLLIHINGDQSIDRVHEDIKAALGL